MIGVTASVFGQSDSTKTNPFLNRKYLDYDNVSPWFFGVNVGATWHSTDVKNKLDYGFGATFGRSFLYKQGSPLFIDARLRYLRAFVSGQDADSTSAITDNQALNGTTHDNVDYVSTPGYAVNNFQTDLHRVSLELVLHWNKLRERTGVDLYAFGGVGVTFARTKGDLLDEDGNQHDYGSLSSFGTSSVNQLLDKNYESTLDGSSNKHKGYFMPSLGLGIGYQVTPKLSLGLEHKTTFTRHDFFDGTDRDMIDNTNSANKDLYHYTSFYLRFNLRKRQPKPVDPIQPIDPVTPVDPINTTPIDGGTTDTKRPPIVEIYDPSVSPFTTQQAYFNLKAKVYYVNGDENIIFKQNGSNNQNFTYNSSTNEFQSQVVLQPGQNIFEITGTNGDGSFTDATVIILDVPNQTQPPIVSISNPPFSPYETSNQYFDLQGKVLNVDNRNQVSMIFNGQTLNNFNFNTSNGATASTLNLREGQNVITLKGVNASGQDQKTVYINYKKVVQVQPPVVNIINPSQQSTTVMNPSYNVIATVLNVTQKNQINVQINGTYTTNFTYNHQQKRVQFGANLIVGANIIRVTATNASGTANDSKTIIYMQQQQLHPPVVTFINPNTNPITVFNPQYNVVARIDHVTNANQIALKVNGIPTSNFSYSLSSKQLMMQSSLVVGANIFEITATNAAGQDEKTTTIIYEQPRQEDPPVVNFQIPSVTPYTVDNPSAKVIASVLNVENASQIQVKVNGSFISNFTFNETTNLVRINRTLVLGSNLFEVIATNLGGTDSDQTTIIYKKQEVTKPTALWLNPASSPLSTFNGSYQLTGKVTGVDSKSNVSVKKNGVSLGQNMWSFNVTTKVVSFNTGLVLGNNIFELQATNEGGSAMATTVIVYEERPCDKPTVQFIQPTTVTTVDNTSLLVKGQFTGVTNSSQIALRVNGVTQSNIGYNAATNQISKTVTLNEGNNVIQIFATNECGITTANKTITYVPTEAPCFTPAIQVIQVGEAIETFETSQLLMATLSNIDNASQVIFKINGVNKPFSFDPATHLFTSTAALGMGLNACQLIVSNDCGASSFTWNITRNKCVNPIMQLNVTSSEYTTTDETLSLNGTISNIENSDQIVVMHNGASVNFIYNPVNEVISISRTLSVGINQITIRATNVCGRSDQDLRITYTEPVVVDPPTIQYTSPSTNLYETTATFHQVKAQLTNVPHKSQILVWVNNVLTQNFSYNTTSGMLSMNRQLIIGDNLIKIKAVNESGEIFKSVIIRRKVAQLTRPANIVMVSPTSNSTLVKTTSTPVVGTVENVTDFSDVQIYVNNQLFNGYTKVVENGGVKFSFNLPMSNTQRNKTVRIVGSNAAGNSERTLSFTFVGKTKVSGVKNVKKDPVSKPVKGNTSTKTPTKKGGR